MASRTYSTRLTRLFFIVAVVLLACIIGCREKSNDPARPSPSPSIPAARPPLRVGIAPYQDMAMLTVYKDRQLDKKHGVQLELVTLPWEEIIPSLASKGRTIDVGFGSLIEYLTKYNTINANDPDPLVYVYPAYVFKGGGFVAFNTKVPNLDESVPPPPARVKQFFTYRIGAQKNSMFDMLLFSLSEQAGLRRDQLKIIDTTMGDGLLAAQAGSLDAAAAGLTQRNEALERGGRVVLTMDKFGFADLTGLIAKRSTVESRREDIEKLLRVWFDSVDYVHSDLDNNSRLPIQWLTRTSSTQYTPATYKRALEAEYLPRSLQDANATMIAADGAFSIDRISKSVIDYLVKSKIVNQAPPAPTPLKVSS